MPSISAFFLLVSLSLITGIAQAEQVLIAVASNFHSTMKQLVVAFEKQTAYKVIVTPGATGKIYAQIQHGAPYDLFFAADKKRPELLEKNNTIVPGTRQTYAKGKLVLWSPDKASIQNQADVLTTSNFNHLAIANPKLAPYGLAAQQVLEHLNLWDTLQNKLVRGENIGQTYQFVASGSAELGFVALSQVKQPNETIPGSVWMIPGDLYQPIEQQAVQLNNTAAATAFMSFLNTSKAKKIIESYGYELP
ncbi:hypothetical protein LCGC14_2803490 [marine sediment metagenome]|uniref:Molybdate ABC transporter substrate-binding protein n=1 Tax=marine sediment metagenome TaxID=412755 RepID=A0A0F9AVE8_9ZZZZ|nr:molybdate ABC transporter substrate-binding protein [Methylophaga sp.]